MSDVQWTYTTLLQALQDWPENDNETYVANLPTMIGLGELRLIRDLDLEIFDTDDQTQSFVVGSRAVTKPTNAISVRSVGYIDTLLGYVPLKQRSVDYCRHYAPIVATTGAPLYYAEHTPTAILVVPTPAAILPVLFRSVSRPTDMLSSVTPNATSYLSVRVSDSLFAACLMEAEHYMQADDRYDDYKKKYYEELLPAARYELRQLQRAGDYSPFNPAARSK